MDWIRPWVEKRCFRARRWGFEVEALTGRLDMKMVLSTSVGSAERVSCWRRGSLSSASSASIESSMGIVGGGGCSGGSCLESFAESLFR